MDLQNTQSLRRKSSVHRIGRQGEVHFDERDSIVIKVRNSSKTS